MAGHECMVKDLDTAGKAGHLVLKGLRVRTVGPHTLLQAGSSWLGPLPTCHQLFWGAVGS